MRRMLCFKGPPPIDANNGIRPNHRQLVRLEACSSGRHLYAAAPRCEALIQSMAQAVSSKFPIDRKADFKDSHP